MSPDSQTVSMTQYSIKTLVIRAASAGRDAPLHNLPETFDDTNAVIVHKNRKMCDVDESLDGFTTAERKKAIKTM